MKPIKSRNSVIWWKEKRNTWALNISWLALKLGTTKFWTLPFSFSTKDLALNRAVCAAKGKIHDALAFRSFYFFFTHLGIPVYTLVSLLYKSCYLVTFIFQIHMGMQFSEEEVDEMIREVDVDGKNLQQFRLKWCLWVIHAIRADQGLHRSVSHTLTWKPSTICASAQHLEARSLPWEHLLP